MTKVLRLPALALAALLTVACGDDAVATDAGADSGERDGATLDAGRDVSQVDTGTADAGVEDVAVDVATDGPDAAPDAAVAGTCEMEEASAVCAGFEGEDEDFVPEAPFELRPGEGVGGSTAACLELPTTPAEGGSMMLHAFDSDITADTVYYRAHYRFAHLGDYGGAPPSALRLSFLGKRGVDGADTMITNNPGGLLYATTVDASAPRQVFFRSEPAAFGPEGEWLCLQAQVDGADGRLRVWINGEAVIDESEYPAAPEGYSNLSFGVLGAYAAGVEDRTVCLDELAFSTDSMPPCVP